IESFINHATQTALITIDVYLPLVHATIHSKAFLETIYNLVGNDLLLWQPAAPQPFGGTSVHFGSSIYPEDSESESSDDSKSRDAPIESNIGNESSVAFTLNIKRGSATAYTQNGQLLVKLVNGSLFYVGCYEGNPLLDYLCIGMEKCQLHYKVGIPQENGKTGFDLPTLATSDIDPILTPSSIRDLSTGRHSSGESGDKMLTTVIKLNYDKPNLKHCMVTTLVSGAMLHHKFVEEDRNWLKQIMDLFELTDNDVLGYDPPVIITQVHLHFEGCCVEYHPYLPQLTQTNSTLIHPLLTIHSMSLSSNIVADSPTSFFHILLDNASLYLATSTERTSLQDLVRVVEVGLLEVSLKINNATKSTNKAPLIDLSIYNNKVRVESCADSFAALINIVRTFVNGILYQQTISIAGYFNIPPPANPKITWSHKFVTTSIFFPAIQHSFSCQAMLSSSGSMYEDSVTDLLADAMTDVAHHVPRTLREGNNKTHRFPITPDDTQFCIIEDPAPGSMDDPEIRYISDVSPICYHDNHFPPVLGKLDQLSAPSSFSSPQLRYSVKELTCTWHMYGGYDLPTSKKQGRDKNTLMEIHLSKVRVRHEIFDEESKEDARSVIIVTEFEVRDRLTTSQINKFLYQFHSEASPKQSQANMLTIKLLQYKPEGSHTPAECKLKVSLQPLKLNIDQDTLDFISKFFENLTMELGKEDPAVEQEETNKEPTSPISNRTETEFVEEVQLSNIQKPLFFREIIFSPEVPIRLDYHGKHIDTDQGTMAGLLMGLGQLNCSQLKLKKIVHRHGILGADKLINFLLNEWAADIRKNQLPSILGGVGPLHSVVQFFQGVHDLFVLPVEQYKRDGRVVRGLQRGTSSFGASATMATLELTNKLVWLVQKAAETTYDVVSPPELHSRREKQNWRTLGRHASRHKQPSDMREGFNNALTVVRSGVSDAAYSIARVAQEEHEQKGLTGAVGGVLRHLPPTLVKPVIIASEATSNVLSGMRNQILPDAKREDDQKWK
uniref:Autophagy-related protein 2 n=1 Tax=Ciona savignyi TaxID=51511 RepID=H2ZNI3_CIOSA